MKNTEYYFDSSNHNDEFVIKNYDMQKPFASFLPGIAGKHGIPLWCHYINRAQGVSSFGLRDKNGSILEFYPANTAYRIIDKMGFRTFIKVNNQVFEPFKPTSSKLVERTMYISSGSFRIEEINHEYNLKIEVTYYGLPNENIAGLVRNVLITSLSKEERTIDIYDGISQLLPSGIDEWRLKHQSNLLKSWMDVLMLDSNIAYYIVNSVPADEAEVNEIESGNYYFSCVNGKIIKPIYDANVIFGNDTTLSVPTNIEKESFEEITSKVNIPADKVAVGFTPYQKVLSLNETLEINTVIGFASKKELIEEHVNEWTNSDYFKKAFITSKNILKEITKDVETSSAYPIFDNYLEQSYLDNVLRGGHPMFIDTDNNHFVYYLYSRRHGDIEREYNFFSIAPEYYSQGNGNFRDVCQNRRSDVLFHPEVGIYNAKVFASLIGLDGYNPLGIGGSTFTLDEKADLEALQVLFTNDSSNLMSKVLSGDFTPGLIINTMVNNEIKTDLSDEELFKKIFKHAKQNIVATFGEGYWSDHWTYIIDIVENALKIYPEKLEEYMFEDETYRYFENPVFVLPRDEKYVLGRDGKVHQYGALIENDQKKIKKLHMDPNNSNWAKDIHGNYLETNLYGKLFLLAFNKFTSLDIDGIGIEMEANKPGWNDAMNGLPGVFGSGVSETIELGRVIEELLKVTSNHDITYPTEFNVLVKRVMKVYKAESDQAIIWDKVSTLKEKYRESIHYGITKEQSTLSVKEITKVLNQMKKVVDKGLEKALELGNGIYPTFLIRRSDDFEVLETKSHYNFPKIKVHSFKTVALPYFLEAPARSLKYVKDKNVLASMYQKIKNTELYDEKLEIYKTSVSLDDWGYDIGRIRAFQKGWLERESDFLHMIYKYLLGLLKANLYEEFYEEIKKNYVCFMDPSRYGRSTLENSSFIATSNNPDPAVWGQGFVSRLSGSTAEILSMWFIMMFGEEPIKYENNELVINFEPKVVKDFFNNGILKVKFLSNTYITYHNESNIEPFNGIQIKRIIIDGKELTTNTIKGEIATNLRDGKYQNIDIFF